MNKLCTEIKAICLRYFGTTCRDIKQDIDDDPVHTDLVIETAFKMALKTNSVVDWRNFSKVYKERNPTHECILTRCCRGINANKCDKEIISLVNAHQLESNFKCMDCKPIYTLECPMAMGYLNKCINPARKDKEMKWISVEDQLPQEQDGKFLVIDKFSCINVTWWYYQEADNKESAKWEFSEYGVTHWMPLPETPK